MLDGSDEHGGRIYHFVCTAELRVKADGSEVVIKQCPDWGRVGRQEPILSDRSTEHAKLEPKRGNR